MARRKAKHRARPKSTCLWQRPLANLQEQGSPEADHELTDIELNTIARSERKITDVNTTNAGDDSSVVHFRQAVETGDNEQASSHEPPKIQNEKSERENDTIVHV